MKIFEKGEKNEWEGHPQMGLSYPPPHSLSTEAQKSIFSQKEIVIFTIRTSRRFFPVLASARSTEKRKKKKKK